MVVNISLYVPLGAVAFLAMRQSRSAFLRKPWVPFIFIPMLGASLSACIEMVQLFTPNRNCNTFDLLNNSIGTVLGVFAAVLISPLRKRAEPSSTPHRAVSRRAKWMLFLWVCYLLFPFFPVTHLPLLRNEIIAFFHPPAFNFIRFVSGAAIWFVGGRLMAASGLRPASRWLALLLLLIPAQFAVQYRAPLPADLLGALFGNVLFLLRKFIASARRSAAWGFLALLLLRGLVPFHISPAQPFTWIPFAGLLGMGNWQPGILVLLEKALFYGSAVWLVHTAKFRLPTATGIVIAVLFLIEVAQIHLAGRVPEITDPLLAGVMGFGLYAFSTPGDAVAESSARTNPKRSQLPPRNSRIESQT